MGILQELRDYTWIQVIFQVASIICNIFVTFIFGAILIKFPKDMEIDRQALCNYDDGSSKYVFQNLTYLALLFSRNSSEIEFILTSCGPLSLQRLFFQSGDFTLPECIIRFNRLRWLSIWDSMLLQEIPKLSESIRRGEVVKSFSLNSKALSKLLLQVTLS